MAVKIARQKNKIAILGVPTSAAALSAGREGAPAALRAAGLIGALQSCGFEVADLGNDASQVFKPDQESPRARNLKAVIASLDVLKPRVEQSVKTGALLLILSGDSSVALATIAGARRYYRNVSVIFMSRYGGLRTPATTSTGSVDEMVASHLTGRGAAELVRFWGEPPLVREPDLALFGVAQLDPVEESVLRQSPIRHYLADQVQRAGAATAAKTAIDRIHGGGNPFVLHLNADVISGFQSTDTPGTSGLTLEEVREAVEFFGKQGHLIGIELTGYNPAKDPDGSGAKLLVDLLATALRSRLEAAQDATAAPPSADATQSANPDAQPAPVAAESPQKMAVEAALTVAGEAWSSESLEPDAAAADLTHAPSNGETSEPSAPSDGAES